MNAFPTNQTCPNGLRAQIVFPSCWNGHDLDSADHQSHMSYPAGGFPDSGDCPPEFPVKVRFVRVELYTNYDDEDSCVADDTLP